MTRSYGVSAAHPLAVDAGVAILEAGGNAVDAAIAVSFCLGVVEPYGSGIGGGGVMLIQPANGAQPVLYDYRETAPLSGVISKSEVGVPGLVKGMETVHHRYGTMRWEMLIDPAIELAEEGFFINEILHEKLFQAEHLTISQLPHFYPHGKPLSPGGKLIQAELAKTLRQIQAHGSEVFYKGELAERIVHLVAGMEISDMERYQVLERAPVYGSFAGYQVVSAPAPLAGITLIQALALAEMFHIHEYPDESVPFLHAMGQILGLCYADRKKWMADPAFAIVPETLLVSRDYIAQLAEHFHLAEKLERLQIGRPIGDNQQDYNNTTHFSIVDDTGMMVSVTNTISDFFGSGLYTNGFFLNNQLRNFSSSGQPPNHAEGGKRTGSHISPTVLLKDGVPVISIGSSGGKRIPTMLTKLLVRMLKNNQPLVEAISSPRFFIDKQHVFLEQEISSKAVQELTNMGYHVQLLPVPMFYGGIHAVVKGTENGFYGAADPRRGGKCVVRNDKEDT